MVPSPYLKEVPAERKGFPPTIFYMAFYPPTSETLGIKASRASCNELSINPNEAHKMVRAAASDAKANPELAKARKPRTPWQWVKGSVAEKEARRALQLKKDG